MDVAWHVCSMHVAHVWYGSVARMLGIDAWMPWMQYGCVSHGVWVCSRCVTDIPLTLNHCSYGTTPVELLQDHYSCTITPTPLTLHHTYTTTPTMTRIPVLLHPHHSSLKHATIPIPLFLNQYSETTTPATIPRHHSSCTITSAPSLRGTEGTPALHSDLQHAQVLRQGDARRPWVQAQLRQQVPPRQVRAHHGP